jgi:hypothetical protein
MTDSSGRSDRFRALLVLAATLGTIIFNWLAASGRVGGVTPAEVSARYPTHVTPSGYAFSIWSLIYVGLIAFSIYQLLPANLVKYRGVRSLYILSCALNCAWIFFWHNDQILICFVIISALLVVLLMIIRTLRVTATSGEYWFAKAPFGLYAGWVTAATLVSFAVSLTFFRIEMSESAGTTFAVVLILGASTLGILVRVGLSNYLYPLSIAWALTAIAIKQSSNTPIVVACAIGVIACLIATLSFVVNLPSRGTVHQ